MGVLLLGWVFNLVLFLYIDFQDRIMVELHSQGKTIQEIEDSLKRAPIHPSIISAIKSAHAFG